MFLVEKLKEQISLLKKGGGGIVFISYLSLQIAGVWCAERFLRMLPAAVCKFTAL